MNKPPQTTDVVPCPCGALGNHSDGEHDARAEVERLTAVVQRVEAHCDEQDAEVIRQLAKLHLAPPDPVGAFTSTTAVRRAMSAHNLPAQPPRDYAEQRALLDASLDNIPPYNMPALDGDRDE